MAGFASERQTIETHFRDSFTEAPIQFENVPFDFPADGIWVALSILNGMSERRAIGVDARRRHHGVISVRIFVPESVGTMKAKQLEDAVVAVLQERTLTSDTDKIYTFDSSAHTVGVVAKGRFMVSVQTPYERDELN